MKKGTAMLLAILACACPVGLRAADDHDHAKDKEHGHVHEKKEAGPNGGKVVTSTEPHFEFFVTADRKVKITFLGEDGKPVPVKEQTVTLTGGDRSNPTKLAFAKEGDVLVSDKALPEGTVIPVVLQVKPKADAKAVTERISVNLAKCPTCEHQEYACTCAHGGDDHDH